MRTDWKTGIMERYRKYALGVRDHLKLYDDRVNIENYKTVWLLEPDFYQYSVSGDKQSKWTQEGGGIPDSEMNGYLQDIVDTIHAYLPGAKVGLDVSPWISLPAAWFANFDLSRIDYAFVSGGRTLANSELIRTGQARWAETYALLGKPIIADAGYGQGGTGTGHDSLWDNTDNLNARIANGVVAVTQMDAALDYNSRIPALVPLLHSVAGCTEPW